MGGLELSFRTWFCIVGASSIVGHMQVSTVSLMTAKAIRTDWCAEQGRSLVASVWKETWQMSSFGNIPIAKDMHLSHLAFAFYVMHFTQLVYALLHSIAIKPGEAYEEVDRDNPELGNTTPCSHRYLYTTPMNAKQGHGLALQALAESAHMSSLFFNDWQYAMEAKQGLPTRYLYEDMKRLVAHFFAFQFLTGSLQANLQTTNVALQVATASRADCMTIVATAVCLMNALKTVSLDVCKAWTLHSMIVKGRVAGHRSEQEEDKLVKETKAIRLLVFFVCVALLNVFMIAYACKKLFVAVFVCPHGMWNLSGCVNSIHFRANMSEME